MSHQCYIHDVLHTHDSEKFSVLCITPEFYPFIDFMPEFIFRHIRFLPSIRGNDSSVCLCGVVNDFIDSFNIPFPAGTDLRIARHSESFLSGNVKNVAVQRSTSLLFSSLTRQSPIIKVRPFLKMLASAISSPFVTGARKLHFNSTVVIPEAGSRTVMAAWAMASSARATISPPCKKPPTCRYSGRKGIRKRAYPSRASSRVILK